MLLISKLNNFIWDTDPKRFLNITKMNIFWGDLINKSAKKEALELMRRGFWDLAIPWSTAQAMFSQGFVSVLDMTLQDQILVTNLARSFGLRTLL